jgi:hypothetical protein
LDEKNKALEGATVQLFHSRISFIFKFITNTVSDIIADASYKQLSDGEWIGMDALTNNFRFWQDIMNLRGSIKQVFGNKLSTTIGVNAEQTKIHFDLHKTNADTKNSFGSFYLL